MSHGKRLGKTYSDVDLIEITTGGVVAEVLAMTLNTPVQYNWRRI